MAEFTEPRGCGGRHAGLSCRSVLPQDSGLPSASTLPLLCTAGASAHSGQQTPQHPENQHTGKERQTQDRENHEGGEN
ncbi:hypothetical protein EYF80_052568 [Liparis tanakae]|uniref:Uncharacterized protein n=1 Tax=Liparis tanakae TaxID=230148 RepID=A0A4Z2F7T9_9TELE|nr:hypothetical protein EYF80_052568 [Liparis tanakae]